MSTKDKSSRNKKAGQAREHLRQTDIDFDHLAQHLRLKTVKQPASFISAGFMFDLEIILRAQVLGYRIREFPVAWRCDPDSRLSLLRSPWPILVELLRIRYWQRRQGLSPAE